MVPRQVCQDSCSNSAYCRQCDAFRNGPGFASCSSTTCGNYYPKDQESLTQSTIWNSGVVGTEEEGSDPSGYYAGNFDGQEQGT